MKTNRLAGSLAVVLSLCALGAVFVSLRPTPASASPPPAPPLSTVTAVTTEKPAVKAASGAGVSFTVDPYRMYTLVHYGTDSTGAAATGLVTIGIDAAPAAADWTEDNNKLPLPSGSSLLIGPFAGAI